MDFYGSLYLDETITRMVTTTRTQIMSLAESLCDEGLEAKDAGDLTRATERYAKAEQVLDLMAQKLPADICPYQAGLSLYIAQVYGEIGVNGERPSASQKAAKLIEKELNRYAQYAIYYEKLQEEGLDDRMSSNDLAIVQQIIPALFETYRKVNPQGIDALINKFKSISVNGERISEPLIKALTMTIEERQKIYEQQIAAQHAAQQVNNAAAAIEEETFDMNQSLDFGN